MTDTTTKDQVPANETGETTNEILSDRGAPKVKTRREQNIFWTLLPVIIIVTVLASLAIGGWFAWRTHRLAQENTSEGAGNVASKTSIGKRRNVDIPESTRRLGVDGEDTAPGQGTQGSGGPRVPAIVSDNPRQAGTSVTAQGQGQAQPIPVQSNQGNSQSAPEAPPRSRYDAPLRFGANRAAQGGPQGGQLYGQPYSSPAAMPSNPGITKASPGTRPDYTVGTVAPVTMPTAAAPQQQLPKGSLSLQTLKTEKAEATLIGNRNFLLAKGGSMDCVLDTALRSNQPGMLRCALTKDLWSDNGQVLLAGRGSILNGEYPSDVKAGQTEIPVIWSRLKTSEGVVIDLASPATDSLGRSGLGGTVNNHWGQRVGAAFLLSFVKDAIGYATATHGNNNATTGVVYGNTANTGEAMADTILKSTINIPATIERAHGTRVKVLVARDLDFSNVYELQLNKEGK